MLPAFIDIRKVLAISVIIANADGKRIAKSPLDLAAMYANGNIRISIRVNEFECQRVYLSSVLAT